MKLQALFLSALLFCVNSPYCSDRDSLIASQTAFAFSLLPALESPNPNRIYSPYSIATCLSMAIIGARGNTESEMQKALFLNVDRKNLPKVSALLNQSLLPKKDIENNYRLNIGNALWVDQGTFLLADFRYAIEEQFKAKLSLIDFTNEEKAIGTINSWISEQTQGKIPKILNPGDLNPLSRLVLTNAIYFEGNWKHPFDPAQTTPTPFFTTPDASSSTLMIAQTNRFPYYENDLIQALAMPFLGVSQDNGRLAYLVLLPKSGDNFQMMMQELPSSFSEWLKALSLQRVSVKIPKFTLSNRFDLNGALRRLGMEDAFTSEANFIGIDGMRDLMINKVIHETFFALDEKGVSATAATAVSLNIKSMPPQEPPIEFTADHPFLFLIVDLNSQEVLFLGKFEQPGAL